MINSISSGKNGSLVCGIIGIILKSEHKISKIYQLLIYHSVIKNTAFLRSVVRNFDDEIDLIKDRTKNQDFIFTNENIYKDPSMNDCFFYNCTYENLVNMKNAGIVYLTGHGVNNQTTPGVMLLFSSNYSALDEWKEGDSNILTQLAN